MLGSIVPHPLRMAWNIQKCIKKWKWEKKFGGGKIIFGQKKKFKKKIQKEKLLKISRAVHKLHFLGEGCLGGPAKDNRHRQSDK